MADYISALLGDLVEQFRGKPNIQALAEVIAIELQEVYDFYGQLRNQRDLYSAVGTQLDGVGDIAVLSRGEAGQYASRTGISEFSEEINDDTYRKYLIYKVLKNTCNCTYPDIIKAFRMFWDKPLYYSEDPELPAVMILDTGTLRPEDHVENLLSAPIIKAAGVGIRILATTEAPVMEKTLHVTPVMGRGMAETTLPELEPEMPAINLRVTPVMGRGMSITKLPTMEPAFEAAPVLIHTAAAMGSIMETRLPPLLEYDSEVISVVRAHVFTGLQGSITETRLPELKEETV